MKVAIFHYSYVPVIGGVEFVIEQHANLFARRGHEVKIVCGSGTSPDDSTIVVTEIESLLPSHPLCRASQESITSGGNQAAFLTLKTQFIKQFRAALTDVEVAFVHNLMTMHFNLAATAALAELASDPPPGVRFINWIHDLAAINPDYPLGDQLTAAPHNLLTQSIPGFENVTISDKRQAQFCDLTGSSTTDCEVFPNGVEFLRLFKLTDPVRDLIQQYGVLNRDIVIIHPTRILRRKNIECGIRVLAELKATGRRCLYLVTGAPDPHSEPSATYGEFLKALIAEHGVENEFIFVNEQFKVSDADLIGLYTISDLLFLPSKQEGFGLPLLEAGLFRLPVFCPRIEPMQSVLKHNVTLFDLDDTPASIAERIINELDQNPGYLARKEVMTLYSWDRLFDKKISPAFLESSRKLS